MTIKVLLSILGVMDGFSTLTQKGQVAIPKSIRDKLNLKPSDRVRFTLQRGKIIAEPVFSADDMLGFVHTKKEVSKRELKQTIKNKVLKKHASHS